ncbi:MAG: polysaccharide biosynthesis protein [Firmicutes bacterium]|nr:polysaccharide biosynthesis protein [Bacillota bacterium]
MVVIDALLVNVAIFLAFLIRYEQLPSTFWTTYLSYAVPMTVIRILSLRFFGLYNRVWQYASIGELVSTIKAVSAGTILNSFYLFFVVQQSFSRGVVVLDWMLNILLIGGSRLGWRMLRDGLYGINRKRHGRRVLIVGAGDGGVLVAREFRNHYRGQVSIVGFIDDDPEKQQQQILGCSVLGDRTAIPHIVDTYRVEEIVIAMPSVERKTIREIVAICQETKADVKILPGVFDLFEGNVTVNQIRHVEVEDLLGREPVKVDLASMSQYISDHVVLVTGAGGSIGSELCRQIVRFSPRLLLLMDICENNMYDIEMELKGKTDVRLVPLVKDVRDRQAVNDIFRKYRPQVIFHAAAHKHVPLMEVNPEEAIKNNAMGTYHVAQAANLYGASKFVLVSTDKAVNPTSVMGASKRIAEMIIQYLNTRSDTNYVAVRFGNVLGSRGSVVPLFKKQIAAGGPVTVTDERMIRYFMTIPEAVQLIIQAGALASGGEIFVLDMGEPVPIMELAETLIKLSGFEPYTDIDIKITGMRPGEKLFEELLTAEEGVNATTHKRIFVAKPTELDTPLIERTLRNFIDGILPNGVQETERFIQAFLPGFVIVRPQDDVQAEPSFVETAASREIVENSIETQKQ